VVAALPHNFFLRELRLLSEVVTVASEHREVRSLKLEAVICGILIAVAVGATLGRASNDLRHQVTNWRSHGILEMTVTTD
jgi:hypothetical protein